MAKFTGQSGYGWLFIAPQILITLIFFIEPAASALIQAFFYSDAFGLRSHFAGLGNFFALFQDAAYLEALRVTFIIALSVTLLTLFFGLLMAVLVNERKKSKNFYKTLLIWPYAVAPVVAAILWRFLCHPTLGWLTHFLHLFGIDFDYINHTEQALLVIVLTASWQQFSYNFLFFYGALQAIPKLLLEAAVMDGAGGWQRFWHITLPLLSPTTFFLLLMNLIYSFFDTFGIIQVMTHGGPGNSTTNLIYKVYEDGFEGMDLGSAAAQSVMLMLLVIFISVLQFKYLEKKVHYE